MSSFSTSYQNRFRILFVEKQRVETEGRGWTARIYVCFVTLSLVSTLSNMPANNSAKKKWSAKLRRLVTWSGCTNVSPLLPKLSFVIWRGHGYPEIHNANHSGLVKQRRNDSGDSSNNMLAFLPPSSPVHGPSQAASDAPEASAWLHLPAPRPPAPSPSLHLPAGVVPGSALDPQVNSGCYYFSSHGRFS